MQHITYFINGVWGMGMLKKYERILDNARSAKLETLTLWYMWFRMKENPFSSQIPVEEIDYFVDRERVVDSIIYDVGVASRGIPLTILVVGPKGSGKTAILLYIHNVLKKLHDEHPKKFLFKGDIVSSYSLFQETEKAGADSASEEEIQTWVRKSKDLRDYLFVDDVKSSHVELIMREFTRTRLKVFSLSPLDYEEVYSKLSVTPKTHFLNSLSFEDTIQMLNKRIERVLMESRKRVLISDLFEEEALRAIYEYSLGIPGLVLRCAAQSLTLLLDMYRSETSINASRRLKVTEDLALKACKIVDCFYAFTGFRNLSRTKIKVLQQILDYGKTPTELSLILGKDRTTISRHLSDLRKLRLVEFTGRGRESVYKATDAVRVMFEIKSMPKGGDFHAPA